MNERRSLYESTDRPISGRVEELKNAYELTTNGNIKDDTIKSKSPITSGITEQRRRMFEDQEWTRRSVRYLL